jgi:hypothetical protein
MQFKNETQAVILYFKSQFYKNFMKGGFAPFNTRGWSNIVTDEKGNIIESENDSDEEVSQNDNDDFDPTDNMISRRRRRRIKNSDDVVLIEKSDEPIESIVDNDSNIATDNNKSKNV